MKRNFIILSLLFLTTLTAYPSGLEEQTKMVVSLNGKWKFMIGDNKAWASAKHQVTDWEEVMVPSTWENQGFPGYDGYAWYRKEFTIPAEFRNNTLELHLGYIDDVDEVYVNGVKIGHKGSFPPNFWTAYNAERIYLIPSELINFSQSNTIAVRVYDAMQDGGMVSGQTGIFAKTNDLPFDISLEGYWKFNLGDNKAWLAPTFNDTEWKRLMVPGFWEDQVSNSYDGFGWYRKQFKVAASATGKRYVLLLGKIDDLDEVYLNGKLVGHTGTMNSAGRYSSVGDEYRTDRIYYLNTDDLKAGQLNTIAVRVYDGGGQGGIYEGPIGLIELTKFVSYWRGKKK